MRDTQQPKYLLVGLDDSHFGLVYQIGRLSDRAVCGADRSFPLDDGAIYKRQPVPRQWLYAEDANKYLRMLEAGEAGKHPFDEPIAWIPHKDLPDGIDWAEFEALGNIEVSIDSLR